MAKVALSLNTYIDPSGNPIANGYLLVRLNVDGSASDAQITSKFIKVPLNSSGAIADATFWANTSISPPGTYYVVKVYSSGGQLIAGPLLVDNN